MPKEKKPKKVRVFKRATIGKRPPRNVYYDGTAGECEPPVEIDGVEIIPLRATRKFGGGERFKLAGVDLIINQRSAADKLGAIEVGRVESRTKPDGTIITRFFGLMRSGKMKQLHEVVSHRFGTPVDTVPLSEEIENAKG